MKVIITIPAFNEEKTLPKVIAEIKEVIKPLPYNFIFLVANDGSTDKTIEVAKKAGAKVVSNGRNRGLAETFKLEMSECLKLNPDIIIHTDADGQYDPKHIPEFIKKIQDGSDLVLGSRFTGDMEHMPFLKRIGNKAFARVLSKLTHTHITDSTTGYRAFTPQVARDINYINTFTYTQEQIIKAAKLGFKITEISINSRHTRESRLFKNPLEYAIKAWINIFRIYRDYDPLSFFGRIGVILLVAGLLMGVWVLYTITTTGGVGGIPRVILSAVLLLSGVQIILFGFLADMFKR